MGHKKIIPKLVDSSHTAAHFSGPFVTILRANQLCANYRTTHDWCLSSRWGSVTVKLLILQRGKDNSRIIAISAGTTRYFENT